MNEEYEKEVEDFLNDQIKIMCDLPDAQILVEKPEIEFSFSKPKKKKTLKIVEKNNDRRKSNCTELF